jgi:nicotinamidase-related amidase
MLLEAKKAFLLTIDVQERLLPAMAEPDTVVSKTQILMQAAATLGVPQVSSEQYPRGLGRTVEGLRSNASHVFEKLAFSCWREPQIKEQLVALHESGRPQAIVAGIESHVCVLQTCIDMQQAGFGVFAVADAMSSRAENSKQLAIARMQASGVTVINTEMAVFELLQRAGSPDFKTLSALIK